MKVCPICDREFDDSKSLCPDDNSLLLCIIPDTEMMDTEQIVINKKTKRKKNHTKNKFVVPALLIIIFTGISSWLILSGFTNAFNKPYEESAIDSILNEPDSTSDLNQVVNADSSSSDKEVLDSEGTDKAIENDNKWKTDEFYQTKLFDFVKSKRGATSQILPKEDLHDTISIRKSEDGYLVTHLYFVNFDNPIVINDRNCMVEMILVEMNSEGTIIEYEFRGGYSVFDNYGNSGMEWNEYNL